MGKKLLFAASTAAHILHFHLPYLQALAEQGWEITAACGGEGEIPFAAKTLSLPFEKKITAPQNFRAVGILGQELRRQQYDLILPHTSLAAFFTRLAVMGLKKRPKVVNMVHGYLFDEKTSQAKRRLLLSAERLTACVTDLVITMNAEDEAIAKKHRLGKAVVKVPGIGVEYSRLVPSGQVTRERLGIKKEQFVLLYAAEFSKRKSQSDLLRAMVNLPEEAVAILPGRGQELDSCKALAAKLGISHRVFFPGYVTNMADYYSLSDCAVSVSRSEGLPFNIMEAMHFSLPVAASAVKGHTDLLRDGETGLLFPYGDSAACAKAILRLMEDEALRKNLAAKAKEEAKKYALDQVFPQVMQYYEA